MQAVIIEARGGKPRSQTVPNTFVPVQFPLKLVDRRMIAPTVAHCQFLRDDGQPLDFQPGQFIQIHFSGADGTPTKRSYSLATIHDHAFGPGEAVDIAVSFVPGGSATALFEGLQIGDQLQASGPYGRFCLPPGDHNRRYVLIATGTGVTPYRSMLPLLAEAIATRGVQVVLLQGARTPSELLYGDDFRAFADAHPQFRYVPCFSRELPDQPHADVRHGYVQQQLVEFAPSAEGDIAYLCGNPDMVDSCIEALKAAGLPNAQIRREKYVSPAPSKT
ncbi:ferredoxin--NADP reductase [Xanthomonas hydrangeae]|uniref:ferredoxin--NADP(+) reductase n=1 Tax=Xanthomonas hydrangeae TaxID=2775159 RepID=A0AAU0BHG4_9XANT|nr:ferredoxin--NADP reductase [Xanthomonas hydrangeae]WOB51650.1 ferredoxin--NADP reductase [Xanthomonas hydrangeae]